MQHWLNRSEYPFQHHYYIVNEQRLHYVDEGEGDVILFVHGTPSWSFDYRHLIKHFSKTHRCIAIDHIGFGLSSKPAEYDYSTQNHSSTLEQFVAHLGLADITIVVHDFGGPIGLSFAERNPDKILRIIVLNSWLWSAEAEPEFQRMKRVLKSPLLPFLYTWLNFSPRFILPASFGDKKLPPGLLQQYTAPFPSRSQRKGPLAFAHSLLNDQDWFEQLWQQRDSIKGIHTLFIWGMKDRVITSHYLDKFISGFTKATVVKLATCGHFPQEEEPQAVIDAMQQFVQNKQ